MPTRYQDEIARAFNRCEPAQATALADAFEAARDALNVEQTAYGCHGAEMNMVESRLISIARDVGAQMIER